MNLKQAIEVFTRGFAAARSRTHPCLAERVGPLWLVRDAPRRDPRKNRRWEYVALDSAKPSEVLRRIRGKRPHRFALCVVHGGEGRRPDIEAAYKALGLRYIIHEPIFAKRIPPIPRGKLPQSVNVARVTDFATARLIAKAARRAQVREQDIADDSAASRLYAAIVAARPVGWVTSIRTQPDSAWVSNLYVQEKHRRQGIGAALMRAMLRDDLARGIRWSVLTASRAGTGLYRKLKYEQVGTLQVFVLRRK